MNHSGDANKMVSDTPRTDAECGDYDRSGCWKSYINGECVQSDFARQLERELNAANSRIELLMSANADVARIAEERDAAEKRIRLLIAKLDKYQDRIKRLVEAGDRMELYAAPHDSDKWNEAKEAKP